MKKILMLFICLILSLGAIGFVGCNVGDIVKTSEQAQDYIESGTAVKSVAIPKFGGKTLTAYSTRSGQTGISKRLSATVEPASALNQLVDYRVFWQGEGVHTEESVSDYIVVEQDSDGSTDATVTCIQAFGDDTIIIQVITRDGGYTAECVATYAGFISEMSITSSTLNTVNTAERGDYYELFTNNTYTFDVNLDNVLHSVGTCDLSVETGGSDEMFWFYDDVCYLSDDTWSCSGDAYSYSLGDIADKFITATISDNVVTVTVKDKQLSNYYEEGGRFHPWADRSFVFASSDIRNGIPSNTRTNENNLPSAYFTVTVADSITNISETIKIWVQSSVNGVSLSLQSIQF